MSDDPKQPVDVLGVGAVSVDDILVVSAYPPADEKVEVLERRRVCGGLAATALVAAARLGATCAYAGSLGDDESSRFVLDCLEREGIDVRDVVVDVEARPIHSVVVVDLSTGTRNIFFDVSGNRGPPVLSPEVVGRARVILIDHLGLERTIEAAETARKLRIPVVADIEGGLDDPHLERLLGLVDHLILAEPFATSLTGRTHAAEALDELWSPAREAVVVTCGPRGSCYRGSTGGAHDLAAFTVDAKDTTGCGDIFHGAYALGLARGQDLRERVRFASAAAAVAAGHGAGGQAAAPSAGALAAFLATQPDGG